LTKETCNLQKLEGHFTIFYALKQASLRGRNVCVIRLLVWLETKIKIHQKILFLFAGELDRKTLCYDCVVVLVTSLNRW